MIYLDNAATTPTDKEAVKLNEKYFSEEYFNPSALYRGAIKVKRALEEAEKVILKGFSGGREAIFTSGGSEADNTAVFSFAKRGNVITTEGEHSAVYECFRELKTRGVEVRFAPLKSNGGVDENALLSLVDEKTTFVSVVHVNNETGAINDINALSRAIKNKNPNVVFHSDGVQAFGKLPVKIGETVDLYSASAHKIGGVKGTGVLIKKKGLKLQPLIFGGGQERGLRSGTENVFGISVFAAVYDKKAKAISENFEKIQGFKRDFLSVVDGCGIKVVSDEKCSPYVLSLSAVGLRGEVLQHMMEDEGVIIGTGSACSSRHRHSRILTACGYGAEILDGALRISFSPENTREEVLFAAENLIKCYNKLKGVMKK